VCAHEPPPPIRPQRPHRAVVAPVRDAMRPQRGEALSRSSRLPPGVADRLADRLGVALLPATSHPSWSHRRRAMRLLRLRPPRHPRPLPRMRYNSRQGERMKRLRRIIFNALAVLSLLLCIATAALWIRSYSAAD